MMKDIIKDTVILRHGLHRCAELSGCEEKTQEQIREFLRTKTDLEVCDRDGWLYAFYDCGRDGAPTIAFRADMDALPMADIDGLQDPVTGTVYSSACEGVSHRCGHDGHSAALCALAALISGSGADCNVCLIFQHAEETGQGAIECAELIDEKKIDEIYAFHNWSGFDEGSIVLGSGTVMCASEGLRIIMTGKPSHASQPEDGINPAAALAGLVLKAAELERDSCYRGKAMATVVGVKAGGPNFGMAPGEGEADLTLRALQEEDMYGLEQELIAFAEKAAREAGLEICVKKQDVFPETCNDADTVSRVRRAAGRLDLAVNGLEAPIRSSEDFGWYQKKCPGTMIFIGNGRNWPQVHTAEYDFNDHILETAAELMYELIKDFAAS